MILPCRVEPMARRTRVMSDDLDGIVIPLKSQAIILTNLQLNVARDRGHIAEADGFRRIFDEV
jgi:hypothetical protein